MNFKVSLFSFCTLAFLLVANPTVLALPLGEDAAHSAQQPTSDYSKIQLDGSSFTDTTNDPQRTTPTFGPQAGAAPLGGQPGCNLTNSDPTSRPGEPGGTPSDSSYSGKPSQEGQGKTTQNNQHDGSHDSQPTSSDATFKAGQSNPLGSGHSSGGFERPSTSTTGTTQGDLSGSGDLYSLGNLFGSSTSGKPVGHSAFSGASNGPNPESPLHPPHGGLTTPQDAHHDKSNLEDDPSLSDPTSHSSSSTNTDSTSDIDNQPADQKCNPFVGSSNEGVPSGLIKAHPSFKGATAVDSATDPLSDESSISPSPAPDCRSVSPVSIDPTLSGTQKQGSNPFIDHSSVNLSPAHNHNYNHNHGFDPHGIDQRPLGSHSGDQEPTRQEPSHSTPSNLHLPPPGVHSNSTGKPILPIPKEANSPASGLPLNSPEIDQPQGSE